MDDEDFNGIVAGLNDAIAHARGNESRGRVMTGVDVKAVRTATKLSQGKFAKVYGFKPGTLRDWEQPNRSSIRRAPDTGSVRLLKMIEADPAAVQQIMAKIPA
jgi:putative transcriptional regulator